jgi:hypothetical protein
VAYVFDDEQQVLRMVDMQFEGEVKKNLELEENFIWLANEEVICICCINSFNFSYHHFVSFFFPELYLSQFLINFFFTETNTNGTQGLSAKGFARSFILHLFFPEIHFILSQTRNGGRQRDLTRCARLSPSFSSILVICSSFSGNKTKFVNATPTLKISFLTHASDISKCFMIRIIRR